MVVAIWCFICVDFLLPLLIIILYSLWYFVLMYYYYLAPYGWCLWCWVEVDASWDVQGWCWVDLTLYVGLAGYRDSVLQIYVWALCVICCLWLSFLFWWSDFIWSVMVVVITFILNCSMGPQCPIFSLNCYSRPYWERNKIFESIFVLVIFASSVYQCFMMFIIIITTNQWSIYYWHYASYWAIKQ